MLLFQLTGGVGSFLDSPTSSADVYCTCFFLICWRLAFSATSGCFANCPTGVGPSASWTVPYSASLLGAVLSIVRCFGSFCILLFRSCLLGVGLELCWLQGMMGWQSEPVGWEVSITRSFFDIGFNVLLLQNWPLYEGHPVVHHSYSKSSRFIFSEAVNIKKSGLRHSMVLGWRWFVILPLHKQTSMDDDVLFFQLCQANPQMVGWPARCGCANGYRIPAWRISTCGPSSIGTTTRRDGGWMGWMVIAMQIQAVISVLSRLWGRTFGPKKNRMHIDQYCNIIVSCLSWISWRGYPCNANPRLITAPQKVNKISKKDLLKVAPHHENMKSIKQVHVQWFLQEIHGTKHEKCHRRNHYFFRFMLKSNYLFTPQVQK